MKKYILYFVLLTVTAWQLSFGSMLYLAPAAWLMLLVIDRRALSAVLRWKTLALLSLLVLGVPFLIGNREAAVLGLPFSAAVFRMNMVMAMRSLIILAAVRMLTNRIPLEHLSGYLRRKGLYHFSRILDISQDILPRVWRVTGEFTCSLRQEKRKDITFITRSMVHFFAGMLCLADDYMDFYTGEEVMARLHEGREELESETSSYFPQKDEASS